MMPLLRLRHEPAHDFGGVLAPPNVCRTLRNLLRRAEYQRLFKAGRNGVSSTAGERRETPAMVEGRSRSSASAARAGSGSRPCRGFVTMTLPLPRYVIAKPLASGST